MYAEIVDEHKVSFRFEEREIYTDEDDLEFNKLQNGPSNKTTLTISSDSSKLSSYSRYSRMSMGIREGQAIEKGPFYDLLHLLVIVLSDWSAGTMLLSDVLGINRKPSFEDFKLFLQTLEVYGAGYEDDIDVNNYKRRELQNHSEAAIYYLERVIKLYDITILSFELQKDGSIVGKMPEKNNQILEFMKFQKKQFETLIAIQHKKISQNEDTIDNDFKCKPEGHLVFLNCGHRGQPSRLEEKRLSRLLRKSLFIPLLEDMQSQEQVKKNALPVPKGFQEPKTFLEAKSIALGDQDFLKVVNVKENQIAKMIQEFERMSEKRTSK